MSGFGAGLGTLAGSMLGARDLEAGQDAVNGVSGSFTKTAEPYNSFGQSFLDPAAGGVGGVSTKAGTTKGYDDFAAGYEASPGVKYEMGQALEAQNNNAAAKGKLLSGSNERALATISEGIAGTGMNTAYNEYLAGNSQQFGQLETALGDMFKAIGVGSTATGQKAGVDVAQMGATSQIAQARAKNDQSKGSGLGSIFGGLGSMAVAF